MSIEQTQESATTIQTVESPRQAITQAVELAAQLVVYLRQIKRQKPLIQLVLDGQQKAWNRWRKSLRQFLVPEQDKADWNAPFEQALLQVPTRESLIQACQEALETAGFALALIDEYIDHLKEAGEHLAVLETQKALKGLIAEIGLQDEYYTNGQARLQAAKTRYLQAPLILVRGSALGISLHLVFMIATVSWLLSVPIGEPDTLLFHVLPLVFSPLLVSIWAVWQNSRAKRATFSVLQQFQQLKEDPQLLVRLQHQISPTQYTFAFLSVVYLCTVVFLGDRFTDGGGVFYLIYSTILIIQHLFFLGRGHLNLNALSNQYQNSRQLPVEMTPDDNDEVIVTLESRLKSIQQRLEGYILESALLGGLAFSGFLQIVSQNIIGVKDLIRFGEHSLDAIRHVIHLRFEDLASLADASSSFVELFCLVSVLSLLSSICFILVITARLRFSDNADRIQHFLTLAHDYNEKEDALYHDRHDLLPEDQERLARFAQQVTGYLQETQKQMARIEPITKYMQLFRVAGLSFFLLVLLTSGLIIANWVAWVFLALLLASQLYFNRNRWIAAVMEFSANYQVIQQRYGIYSLSAGLCLLGLGLAMCFHGFGPWGFGVQLLGWALVVMSRPLRWISLAEALFYLAFVLKMNSKPGADMLIILSTPLLFGIYGYVYLDPLPKLWQRVFVRISLFFGHCFVLFYILRLPGSEFAHLTSTLLTGIIFIYYIIQLKYKISSIIINILLWLFLFAVLAHIGVSALPGRWAESGFVIACFLFLAGLVMAYLYFQSSRPTTWRWVQGGLILLYFQQYILLYYKDMGMGIELKLMMVPYIFAGVFIVCVIFIIIEQSLKPLKRTFLGLMALRLLLIICFPYIFLANRIVMNYISYNNRNFNKNIEMVNYNDFIHHYTRINIFDIRKWDSNYAENLIKTGNYHYKSLAYEFKHGLSDSSNNMMWENSEDILRVFRNNDSINYLRQAYPWIKRSLELNVNDRNLELYFEYSLLLRDTTQLRHYLKEAEKHYKNPLEKNELAKIRLRADSLFKGLK